MCSNLSASHCLILWSFPAVKKRWDLGTNCRYITLKSEKSDQMSSNSTLVKNLMHSFEELVLACLVIYILEFCIYDCLNRRRHSREMIRTGLKGTSLKRLHLPVIVCKERLVAVPKVQTPDFHIPVSRACCY